MIRAGEIYRKSKKKVYTKLGLPRIKFTKIRDVKKQKSRITTSSLASRIITEINNNYKFYKF